MDQRRLIVGHAVKICIWVHLDLNLYVVLNLGSSRMLYIRIIYFDVS